jgi:TRAP-type C4-dicarboxylate transport system permease small subunit
MRAVSGMRDETKKMKPATTPVASTSSSGIDRLVRAIDYVLLAIGAVALFAMMFHIAADILLGLLLNSPIPVTSAMVTQYYMIAVAFLPLAAAEYRGSHIGVDLFVKRMPEVSQRGALLFVLTLCTGMYGLLAVQAWEQAMMKFGNKAFLVEQSTHLSVWPSFFMVPVGFSVIAALVAIKLVYVLLRRPEIAAPQEVEPHEPQEGYGNV